MSFTITPTRVAASHFEWFAADGPAAAVREVVDAATAQDGSAPLDEASLLVLRRGLGSSALWLAGSQGFAWRHDGALELVVAPAARGHGVGGALAEVATSSPGALTVWSHGDHPAAAALSARHGFDRVRDLWVLRRPLSGLPPVPRAPDGIDVRTFRVGEDEEAFLALNAKAFEHHPEQSGLTRAGLDERLAEPWFDPAGFFVASRDDRLVGFHWTKVHDEDPPHGEVYVVGVAPEAQGSGLGALLTATGLQHLATLGLDQVLLYVEADNAPAVRVYERLGFRHAAEDTHVQYARTD